MTTETETGAETGQRPGRPRRVYLHIGSPKTGTTYLQDVLWSQRATAASQGLRLAGGRFFDHFLATLDVRGLADAPQQPPRAVGAWGRLVKDACTGPGDALISHELFAGATPEQAGAAMAAFPSDVEVHLILTVRDLARQIPAEWQEHVKHRYTKSLASFCRRLRRDTEGSSWFWRVQDYARLLERWGADLPREHVHVVTVPPRGADPKLLWERFSGLLGLDPDSFDARSAVGNTSLGYEQVEVLRQVNRRLGDDIAIPGPYPRVVKEIYAQQILAARPGSSLRVDAATYQFARTRSIEVAAALGALGVDVVGDLDDLVPPPRRERGELEDPSAEVLLEEALEASAGLIARLAERGPQEVRYRSLMEDIQRAPARFIVREYCRRHPGWNRARFAYHRVRVLTRLGSRPSPKRTERPLEHEPE